jgi:hypothetical protein
MPPKDFRVRVVGTQVWDPAGDNVDVEVTLADGSRFGATFFTVKNVERLFQKNRATGECAGGIYLWAANMILVQQLTREVIQKAVEDLLDNDEFYSAFSKFGKP